MLRSALLAVALSGLLYWLVVAPISSAGQRTGYNPAALLEVRR